jgi:hypothetical protein
MATYFNTATTDIVPSPLLQMRGDFGVRIAEGVLEATTDGGVNWSPTGPELTEGGSWRCFALHPSTNSFCAGMRHADSSGTLYQIGDGYTTLLQCGSPNFLVITEAATYVADYVAGDFAREHIITIPTGSDPIYPRSIRRLATITGLCAYGDSACVAIFDGSPDEDEELFSMNIATTLDPELTLATVGPAPSRVTIDAPVDGFVTIWQHLSTGGPEAMFSGAVAAGVATELTRGALASLLISPDNPLMVSYLDSNGDPIAETISINAHLSSQEYSESLGGIHPWGVVTVRPDGIFTELLPPGGWLGVAPFGGEFYTADMGAVWSLQGVRQVLPFSASALSLADGQLILRERREMVDYYYALTPAILFKDNQFTLT